MRTRPTGRSTTSITDGLRNATDEELRRAVEAGDPIVLRTLVLQFGGDPALAELPRGGDGMVGADRAAPPPFRREEDEAVVRERAIELLRRLRDDDATAATVLAAPEPATMHRLLELTFDLEIDPSMVAYWREEFGIDPVPRALPVVEAAGRWRHERFTVAVIGSGMSGISAAVHLKQSGIEFSIVEKNPSVGGTWYENHYPGTRVDVDSRAYSYTFEPDYDWDHHYALQPELLAYFNEVVDKHGLRDRIRFEREVKGATWDEGRGLWTLDLLGPDGPETLTAHAVIAGVGLFNRPIWPSIEGLDLYRGELLHTARWDDAFDPHGKRVGVIGTGSSGVQVVAPLADRAERLHVFQRSGTWLANVPGYTDRVGEVERWLLHNVPYYLHWVRLLQMYAVGDTRAPMMAVDPDWTDPNSVSAANKALREALLAYVHEKLGDRPDLLAQCIPTYPPLAKRLPKDNGWYDAIKRPHVCLVSDPIERFDQTGIITASGEHHELDAVVLATGFNATGFLWPMRIVGRGEHSVEEAWSKDGARAYLGVTMPHFPNFFMLYGPNTNPRAGSPASWGEMQVRYAVDAINYLIGSGTTSAEVREDVFAEFNTLLDDRLTEMIWSDPRQTSYYVNEHGRIATNGPWFNREYWNWTRRFKPAEYHLA